MGTLPVAVAMFLLAVQTPIMAAPAKKLDLSISQCRKLALERNLDIKIAELAPALSRQNVIGASGIFDPALSAATSYNWSQPPGVAQIEDVDAQGNLIIREVTYPKSEYYAASVGVDKKFAFGTELGFDVSTVLNDRSTSSVYTSTARISVSQPILKGFGKTATEGTLIIARKDLANSESKFRDDVATTISETEQDYWSLVQAKQSLRVAELSMKASKRLLDEVQAGAATGTHTISDIIEAQADLASKQQIILARQAVVRDREDVLRTRLHLTLDPGSWESAIVPSDTPAVGSVLPPVDTLLAVARRDRRDLRRARMVIKIDKISVQMKKNSALPSLDVTGSLALKDSDDDLGTSADDIPTAKYRDWRLGLDFRVPIGNRSASSSYRTALIRLKSNELTLRKLELQVQSDVRSAYRQVESTRKQIAAAALTRRLRERQLDVAMERLRLGLVTSYNVIQAQEYLATARDSYLSAQIGHQKAFVDLELATGTLLSSRNIKLVATE
jgi:outer membrane protein